MDLRTLRQGFGEPHRVIDGAFAHRAMLVGIDMLTEFGLQAAPFLTGIGFGKRPKAAQGARCRAMYEYQYGPVFGQILGGQPRRFVQIHRCVGIARGPAV